MKTLEQKILEWVFTSEDVGMSSKAMAAASVGVTKCTSHPHDPSDLNRCVKLVGEIPEIKEKFHLISELSPTWKRLIDKWDELESTLKSEVESGSGRAPKTYDLIKSIIN